MIKVEKKGDKFMITIECNHSIVDDCYLYSSMDAPSQGKELIMITAGKAYEDYVQENAPHYVSKTELDEQFKKVSVQLD